ncbi:hypothetical protein [Microvirga massiliensis]|uniref:hypothetical protein n=1 Tax=Microvirga massiliensis TaxID=1033741 RepID=UPI00062BEC6D|nr:hypothetical protein [Microvirga massiliensis]
MAYKITSFHPDTGRIEVDYDDGRWNAFFVPVDLETGEYYTGERLDAFVEHMKPPRPITGSNPEAIAALVEPRELSLDERITQAPPDLVGGPTLGEVYYGNP